MICARMRIIRECSSASQTQLELKQCVFPNANRFPTTFENKIRISIFIFCFPAISENGIKIFIFVFRFP